MAGAVMIAAGMMMVAAAAFAQSEPTVTHRAVIKTTAGDINIELYGNDAPKAVENFVALANKGFYRGLRFHRVVPNFVIQTGDPNSIDTTKRDSWGRGGQSIFGKPFEDELNPNAPSYKRGYVEGTLAMANRGPNTNTSQFFIVLNNNAKLQQLYTIFGKVVTTDTSDKSMAVVHTIERAALSDPRRGLPITPVMITDIIVTPVAPSTGAKPR
jgi:cyclophilin family peptidyl-prolyl cis-trans isomerase